MFFHLFKSIFLVPPKCFIAVHKKDLHVNFYYLRQSTSCKVASPLLLSSNRLWIIHRKEKLMAWLEAACCNAFSALLTFHAPHSCVCVYTLVVWEATQLKNNTFHLLIQNFSKYSRILSYLKVCEHWYLTELS